MDAHAADRRFLSQALEESLALAQRRLEGGAKRRMGAGKNLAAHGHAVLSTIRSIAVDAARDFDDALTRPPAAAPTGDSVLDDLLLHGERDAALDKLRKAVQLSRYLCFSLVALEEPRDLLGLGAAYLLKDAATLLVSGDVELIETPVDAGTYATVSWPFEAVLNRVSKTAARGARPVMVWFPRSEASNVLLVPLLVHELGHPCWDEHSLSERLWATLTQGSWHNHFEAVAAVSVVPRNRSSLELELRTRLEEHFCDALACAILGPAYLLAFASWVAAISLTSTPQQHPPTLLRIDLLMTQLAGAGWDRELERVRPVRDWLEGLVAATPRYLGISEPELAALRAAHDAVVELALEQAGALRFDPQLFAEQGPTVEEQLDAGILPAQLDHDGHPADRRVILLAGWLSRIDSQPPEHLADALSDRTYQAFLDKALEMSVVLDRWVAR